MVDVTGFAGNVGTGASAVPCASTNQTITLTLIPPFTGQNPALVYEWVYQSPELPNITWELICLTVGFSGGPHPVFRLTVGFTFPSYAEAFAWTCPLSSIGCLEPITLTFSGSNFNPPTGSPQGCSAWPETLVVTPAP